MADYARDNTYILDPDLLEEMHRLDIQGQMLTRSMGGVLPERPDFAGIKKVLDLGCGSAEWALQVASYSADIQVMGIDKAPRMIELAQARAYAEKRTNARFRIGDITEPLPFLADNFDLVNARLLRAFMATTAWPPFIQECWRVLRPGGLIRLTEDEVMLTNSQACDQLTFRGYKNVTTLGKAFSGYHPGITTRMRNWLKEAGFQEIQDRVCAMDISYGSDAYENFLFDFKKALQLLKPFSIQMNPEYTSEEIDMLNDQALAEMEDPTFSGKLYLVTTSGQKRVEEAYAYK
jgi:ubiquinone/menaquinone biosynthesis C-methylase UbiE